VARPSFADPFTLAVRRSTIPETNIDPDFIKQNAEVTYSSAFLGKRYLFLMHYCLANLHATSCSWYMYICKAASKPTRFAQLRSCYKIMTVAVDPLGFVYIPFSLHDSTVSDDFKIHSDAYVFIALLLCAVLRIAPLCIRSTLNK
jgi:hypothetical protein